MSPATWGITNAETKQAGKQAEGAHANKQSMGEDCEEDRRQTGSDLIFLKQKKPNVASACSAVMESSAVGRPHLDGLLGQRVTRCACASPSRGVALCLALGNKGTAHFRSRCAALTTERVRTPELVGVGPSGDSNQQIREGSHEADLVRLQVKASF